MKYPLLALAAFSLPASAIAQSTPTPPPSNRPPPGRGGPVNKYDNFPRTAAEVRAQTAREAMARTDGMGHGRGGANLNWDDKGLHLNQYDLALQMAQCIYLRDAEESAKAVGGEMSPDPQYQRLQRLIRQRGSECVSAHLLYREMMVPNGALGEILLEHADLALPDKKMPDDIVAAQAFYLDPRGFTAETLGRCLAVFSPGLIMKVLDTRPGSDAEEKALETVFSETPECGHTQQPKSMRAPIQRAVMAAGLYHLLKPGETRATEGAEVPLGS